jgi:pantetheine-phosphate adenylyltransferase
MGKALNPHPEEHAPLRYKDDVRRQSEMTMDSDRKRHRVYEVVAMGGTFDVLHSGHKELLRKAFAVGRKVMIGVTSDEFARSLHKPHKVDPYPRRKVDLERLLGKWRVLPRARIVPLDNRYGPTVESSRINALIVSRRTIGTAYEINAERKAKGLKPLEIVPIDLLLADDHRPISSTRIRRGMIDRRGRLVRARRRRVRTSRTP